MRLYDTQRWRRLRLHVLDHARWRCQWPGCNRPLRTGRSGHAAGVVDHKVPHKGDPALFFDTDNLWALCQYHHDSAKQQEEKRGFSGQIGPDGYPLDPMHPCYGQPRPVEYGFSIPTGMRPSAIPVVLVCGAPASGKSTYVAAHAKRGDTVVDFDAIRQRVGGTKWDADRAIIGKAFAYRNRILHQLADRRSGTCWLIVTAPTTKERDAWCAALGNVREVVVMDTDEATCMRRVAADPERKAAADQQRQAIVEWFRHQRAAAPATGAAADRVAAHGGTA